MNQPAYFQLKDDYAVFHPAGDLSLPEAVQLITEAVAFAHEQHLRKLMVVTTDLTGFGPPALGTRYFFIQEWARAARGMVRLAVVVRKEMLDPRKFGVTVAANSGLIGDVFETEEEAQSWLQCIA